MCHNSILAGYCNLLLRQSLLTKFDTGTLKRHLYIYNPPPNEKLYEALL